MGKIFFFNVSAYGHVNPTIQIVKELQARGHDITYYNYNSFKEHIERENINFQSYNTSESTDLYKIRKALSYFVTDINERKFFSKKLLGVFNSPQIIHSLLIGYDTMLLLEETIELLNSEKPDCIVVDNMCPWPRLAAMITNTKVISGVVTLFEEKDQVNVNKIFPDHERLYKYIDEELIRVRIKNNLDIFQTNNELFSTADDIITYTSMEFLGDCEQKQRKSVNFVGTTFREEQELNDIDKEILDKINEYNGIKVYISLGTIINDINFNLHIINHLSEKPILVILNIGKLKINDLNLKKIPDNFIIKNNFNQIEIIKNVDAVICHGGMSTTHESILFKKPVWVIPLINDNYLWSEKVVVNRVGISTGLEEFLGLNIYEQIFELVMDNTIKENLDYISGSFRKAGGALKAADIIEIKATNS